MKVTAQCAPLDSSVDNMASNGVLHKLKSVAVPPSGTIAEALSSCSIFETLASAVEMADLMEVLSGECILYGPLMRTANEVG